MKPDRLDWQIIELLRKDGRTSNSEIARQLNIAEGTVRMRVKRLCKAGVFRISGQINPEFLIDHQLITIGIKVKESKSLEKTLYKIAKLEHVSFAAITSGRYDIIAQVLVDSNKGLINFLTQSLAKIQEISSTETFVMLKTVNSWI